MRIQELKSNMTVLGFIILTILIYATTHSSGESSTCLTVYKEGGAPAVFQSPECPLWNISDYNCPSRTSSLCQSARLQGRRKYQEDRIVCDLDIHIPFPGERGLKEVTVGIVAVFDGHGGAEASEMASKLLLEFKFSLPGDFDDSFHLEILKEALLRAIRDIDAAFTKEASIRNLHSGSTAAIVLIAEGQILVANIGDSKALLCSPAEAKVKELTRDHHPDREDERFRVEAAGGYVLHWGVPRVNGQLAVSRAIGDLSFRNYGVISVPEVTDWQSLTANDSFLVVACDGVFETLSLQDVCDEIQTHGATGSGFPSSCPYSLADCVVKIAFEKGSMDNVAAVVVPLGSFVSENPQRKSCTEGDILCLKEGLEPLTL